MATTTTTTTTPPSRGAFIVFEGIDRCGKTTQCAKLIAALQAQQHSVFQLRFPNDATESGKLLRAFLTNKTNMDDRAAHLLFSANRWECVKLMTEKLREGTTIVCDRYAYSGVAFTAFKGYDLEWCRSPDRGLPAPDAVLYLKLSIEEAMQRGGFGNERYEKKEAQTIVKRIYEDELRDEHWQVFDANQSVDELHAQLLAASERAIADARHKPLSQMFAAGEFKDQR
jgi:dTMP kinase